MFLQEMFMLSLANTFVPNMLQFSSILMNSAKISILASVLDASNY